MHCGCWAPSGTPVSLRFVPHAYGSEVRSLPLIITCPFAEPLCSCSPLTAEKKGSCPQPGGFGQSESALSGFTKSSTLGRGCNRGFGQSSHCPLCAVPL